MAESDLGVSDHLVPRRRRDRSADRAEALIKLVLVLLVFVALGLGGIQNFPRVLAGLVSLILTGAMIVGGVAIVVGIIVLIVKKYRRQPSVYEKLRGASETVSEATSLPRSRDASVVQEVAAPYRARTPRSSPTPAVAWTAPRVRSALDQIDWFQFEKFCAALLRADGFDVERKGGAQPDGGVDLVVRKGEQSALIQCKHWRGWVVQERVVREMLGSMTHFGVKQGAIYTLKGWTRPAEQFAKTHAITLVNGDELAASAAFQLTQSQLHNILQTDAHHFPKCESLMVWRTGNFEPFWGCRRYPHCRGKLKHTGAR